MLGKKATVKKLLKEGKLRELEAFLKKASKKDPSFYTHLVHLYLETERLQEASEVAERLSVVKPSPYSQYLHFLCLSRLSPDRLLEEHKGLSRLLQEKNLMAEYMFYSGVINLLMGNGDVALRRFREAGKRGNTLAHWGAAELLKERDPQIALREAKKAVRMAGGFPPILKLLAELEGNRWVKMLYLFRYLNAVPIDSEASYELGMHLLEASETPVVGGFLKEKAVQLLTVKALLDSPKAENWWIYRVIALHLASKGRLQQATKWTLIEQQIIYNIIYSLQQAVKHSFANNTEEVTDMVYSLLNVLVDNEYITEEEFNKAFSERRETRLLEKMLQLSEDEDNEGEG